MTEFTVATPPPAREYVRGAKRAVASWVVTHVEILAVLHLTEVLVRTCRVVTRVDMSLAKEPPTIYDARLQVPLPHALPCRALIRVCLTQPPRAVWVLALAFPVIDTVYPPEALPLGAKAGTGRLKAPIALVTSHFVVYKKISTRT